MQLITRARRFMGLDDVPAPFPLAVAILGVAALVAVVAAGGVAGTLALLMTTTLVVSAMRQAATERDSSFAVRVVAVAFLTRALLAAALDIVLTQGGRGGALFLDDASYLKLATQIARAWHEGTAVVGTDPSLDNNYVRFIATVLFAFGPVTVLVKILNTGFGVAAAVMVYRTMVNLRLPGARVGLLLVLFFPSLVLWSALALKDAYVLCFTVAPVWLMSEYARSRRLLVTYLAILTSLLAIYNVRAYVFVILALAWPLTVPFVLGRKRWITPAAIATGLAAILIVMTPALTYINPNLISGAEYVRQAMAIGARSGFVEPLPAVRGNAGDRFTVTVPGRTPVPFDERRTIVVQPGQAVAVEGSEEATASDPKIVIIRPGDIIVIATFGPGPGTTAPATATPSASGTPQPVAFSAVGKNVVATLAPAAASDDALTLPRGMLDGIQYLPHGLAYVIGAPFPLATRTVQDAAAIPEMLVWYVCELLGLWGLVRLIGARRFGYAYGLAALLGIGLVLSLFEGNVGTLVRHRGMMIPFVAVLSAVGVADLLERLPGSRITRTLIGR